MNKDRNISLPVPIQLGLQVDKKATTDGVEYICFVSSTWQHLMTPQLTMNTKKMQPTMPILQFAANKLHKMVFEDMFNIIGRSR